jgi:amino acid permease
MKSGGFLPSVLTLGSSMLGMGFMTLPQIGKQNGMIPMLFMILVSVTICLVGNLQITRAYIYTKRKTYPEVVEELDGPLASKIATFFIMIYMYLVSALFYVFCPQLLFSFLNNTNNRPSWLPKEEVFSVYMTLLIFPINYICSLTPKLSSLKYFAFLASAICVVVTAATAWYMDTYKQGYLRTGATYTNFNFNSSLFGGYCLSFFSTMNQFGVVNVLDESIRPSADRMYKMIFASILIPTVCYFGIGIAGYSICGSQCPDVIINMLPPPGFSNPIIEYCKLLFVLCLMVGIILRNQISHTSILKVIGSCQNNGLV